MGFLNDSSRFSLINFSLISKSQFRALEREKRSELVISLCSHHSLLLLLLLLLPSSLVLHPRCNVLKKEDAGRRLEGRRILLSLSFSWSRSSSSPSSPWILLIFSA